MSPSRRLILKGLMEEDFGVFSKKKGVFSSVVCFLHVKQRCYDAFRVFFFFFRLRACVRARKRRSRIIKMTIKPLFCYKNFFLLLALGLAFFSCEKKRLDRCYLYGCEEEKALEPEQALDDDDEPIQGSQDGTGETKEEEKEPPTPRPEPNEGVVKEPISMVLTGQALIKLDPRQFWDDPYGTLKPILKEADIAFTNFEMAVNKPSNGCRVDERYVLPLGIPRLDDNRPGNTSKPHAVKANVMEFLTSLGFNLISLTNNHAYDLGPCGVEATMQAAKDHSATFAGAATSLEEATAASYMEVKGHKIALIAATTSNDDRVILPRNGQAGVNGIWTGNSSDWQRNLSAIEDAAQKADIVIFYHHFQIDDEAAAGQGDDGHRDVGQSARKWQEKFYKAAIDAGASLYVAHGHRGFEGLRIYKNRPVFSQLGGLAYQGRNPDKGHYDDDNAFEGLMVRLKVAEGKIGGMEFIPIELDEGNGYRKDYQSTEEDPDDISLQDTKNTDPSENGMAGFLARRGHASLASPQKSTEILGRFRDLSSKNGVEVLIEDNRGYYQFSP